MIHTFAKNQANQGEGGEGGGGVVYLRYVGLTKTDS